MLLNKIDLLDRADARKAHAVVSSLRDGLRIIETSEHTMPDLPTGNQGRVSRFKAIEAIDTTEHERQFRRWSYQRDGAFDRKRLERQLAQLPPQLLRLKGHCRLVRESGASLLQMVGQDWVLTPAPAGEWPEQAGILLVGVGTDDLPDAAGLDAILDGALVSATDASATSHERQRWTPTADTSVSSL